jgi:hypothetical protein
MTTHEVTVSSDNTIAVDLMEEPLRAAPGEYTAGLRALADLLDKHDLVHSSDAHRHLICCWTKQEMADVIRRVGGKWEKDAPSETDDYYGLMHDLGGGVTLRVYAPRKQVCERRVVGTRTVLKPAPDAPMVEVEEDIVEWECAPSILADAA